MKKFQPPTIEEVRARIIEKEYFTVDAQEFLDMNEAGEWHDNKGRPIKYWKKALVTWYYNSLRYGQTPNLCRVCKKYGEYTNADDTGQMYWLCADHKPQPKTILPEELTENIGKVEPHIINVNNERNRQKDRLGTR